MNPSVQNTQRPASYCQMATATAKSVIGWSFGKTVAIAKPCLKLSCFIGKEAVITTYLAARTYVFGCATILACCATVIVGTTTIGLGAASAIGFYTALRQPTFLETISQTAPDSAHAFRAATASGLGFLLCVGMIYGAYQVKKEITNYFTPPQGTTPQEAIPANLPR